MICDVAETVRARPAIALMEMLGEATALGSRRMFLTSINDKVGWNGRADLPPPAGPSGAPVRPSDDGCKG
ncbi:MAG: hypothetical protein WBQ86_00835 [Candidatus Binatus sp.]